MGMMSYTGRLPHDQRYRIGPGATLGKVYQDLYKLYNVTLRAALVRPWAQADISPAGAMVISLDCTAPAPTGSPR